MDCGSQAIFQTLCCILFEICAQSSAIECTADDAFLQYAQELQEVVLFIVLVISVEVSLNN